MTALVRLDHQGSCNADNTRNSGYYGCDTTSFLEMPKMALLKLPGYTQEIDVKAIGRRSNRMNLWRTSAPLATLALFLRPCFSMTGCVGQPLAAGRVPESGIATPTHPVAYPVARAVTEFRTTLESRHD